MGSSTAKRLDLASEALLILLVIGTPLAFGSVETWAAESMKAGAVLFALLRMAARRAHGHKVLSGRILGSGGILVPAALFILLAASQAIPVPSALIRVLAPATHALYAETVPGFPGKSDYSMIEGFLLDEPTAPPLGIAGPAVAAPPARSFRTISIYPAGTREQLGLLIAYLLLFFSTVDFALDEARRRRLLLAVTLTGFGIAAFALVQKLTWNGKIFWMRVPSQGGEPFGPFVNRNHFAGYMELVLPISLGLLLTVWRHRASRPAPEDRIASAGSGVVRFPRLEENKASLFAGWGEAAVPKTALIACALAVSIAAILISGSRGGLLATSITFLLFTGALVPAELRRRTLLIASSAGVAVLAVVLLASSGIGPFGTAVQGIGQAGAEPTYASRWVNWVAMRPLIQDHLFLGTGLGTFRQAYAGHYPPGVLRVWSQAHNDYIQVLVEAGLAGGILVALVLAAYLRRTFLPGLRAGREREIRLGLAMALVSLALHSLVDFNLQIPSNGFLTVVLAGTLAGIVTESRERRGRTVGGEPAPGESRPGTAPAERRRSSRENHRTPPMRRLLAAGGAILLLACAADSIRRFLGDLSFSAAVKSLDARRLELAAIQLESAGAWDPGRSDIQVRLGDTLVEIAEAVPSEAPGSRERVHSLLQGGLGAYLGSLDASPSEAPAWSGIASIYEAFALAALRPSAIDLSRFAAGAPELPVAGSDPVRPCRDISLSAITLAAALEPNGFEFRDERAAMLLEAGLTAEGNEEIRRAAFMAPRIDVHAWSPPSGWTPEATAAIRAGMGEALESNRLVPADEIWRNLGEIALARGDLSEAETAFRNAVHEARDSAMTRVYSYYLGEALTRAGKTDEALQLYGEAAKERVVEAPARLRMGEILLARGRGEEAFSELRKAVLAAPRDVRTRMALARVATETGRMDVALDSLESAVSLAPRDPEPLRQMVEVHRRRGDRAAAYATARRLVERWPDVASFRDLLDSLEGGTGDSRKEPGS